MLGLGEPMDDAAGAVSEQVQALPALPRAAVQYVLWARHLTF